MAQPTVNLWDLADLCTPWCVHAAATLRIADHIAAGHTKIAALAEAANCDRDALHALLGHLVQKGVFEESAPGQFALNEAARQLLDPLTRMSLDLEGIGGRFAQAWGTILPYVRTGEPAYSAIFGRPFFEDLQANPEIAASFDALIGPAGHGTPNPQFEITGGWKKIQTLADVGGGTGAMLVEVLRLHPHLHGILIDLPDTVARAQELLLTSGVADRVRTAGQSFFNPLPPGADLYLLRGILNDWPDHEAETILRRCAEAARPNGRVVVLKSVSPDDTPKDLTIEMVLLGGKHRTLSAFRQLAAKAGLEVVKAGQQEAYYVVECKPG